MAYTILTESYGRRLPKITATAESTDDLATLGTDFAEGSTVVIGDKTYSLDKVQGWVEPGSGGGGGSVFAVTVTEEGTTWTCDKTWKEIHDAFLAGDSVYFNLPVYDEGDEKYAALTTVSVTSGQYNAYFMNDSYAEFFATSAEDGYPSANFD